MVEIDVSPLPAAAEVAIVTAAAALGLVVATISSLRKYPGSRHWHLRKPGMSGTLEATYWPAGHRFWVAYHSNRAGDGWVARVAPEFAALLKLA
jgi:hypothetical protein